MHQTVSEARKQFNSLISSPEVTLISKNGKPTAVIVPYEQYRQMVRLWKHHLNQEAIERAKQAIGGESELLTQGEVSKLLKDGELHFS